MKKLIALLLLLSLTLSWGTSAYASAPEDDLQVLHDVISLIDERFLQDVDNDQLISGALAGMLQALGDPYSEYFSPAEYEDFLAQVTAQQAGIGVIIQQDEQNRWLVQSVIPGSPAEDAGLREGDILCRADDQDLFGLALEDLQQLLGGAVDSLVTLTIERDGLTMLVPITRALINQPTISSAILPGGIGYVYLGSFGEDTANELAGALENLRAEGMRALLLDLRDDPGGMMSSVVDVSQELLPAGAVMTLVNRAGEEETVTVDGPGLQLPMAVLVNQLTASAAEVLAGAIHDRAGGLLVGERTYGKGVMQEIYELGDGGKYGAMKITTAEFFTPNGTKIQEIGLKPDLEVTPDAEDEPFLPAEATLYPGMQGDSVQTLQRALGELGLYQGPIDGQYDDTTRLAVSQVQQSQGDPVADGVCDGWTQMLINDLLTTQVMTTANQQMMDAARSWLMGQVLVKQLGFNRWINVHK